MYHFMQIAFLVLQEQIHAWKSTWPVSSDSVNYFEKSLWKKAKLWGKHEGKLKIKFSWTILLKNTLAATVFPIHDSTLSKHIIIALWA